MFDSQAYLPAILTIRKQTEIIITVPPDSNLGSSFPNTYTGFFEFEAGQTVLYDPNLDLAHVPSGGVLPPGSPVVGIMPSTLTGIDVITSTDEPTVFIGAPHSITPNNGAVVSEGSLIIAPLESLLRPIDILDIDLGPTDSMIGIPTV